MLCLDLATTGDAIVSSLQALIPMVERSCALHELVSGMTKLPQVMINVQVPNPVETAQCAELRDAIAAKEKELAQRGRVLVRASGTEPLLRVMVEGEDSTIVREVADELAQVAQSQA